MPAISIPIHDIVYRDIKVPISLNYHAASIKPDQPVGWVGLGWSLMSGGVISREMRGFYDESVTPKGFLLSYDKLNVSNWNTQEKLWEYSQSLEDVFPDVFRFSMNGYSGEIIFSHTGSWEVISDKNIKVVFDRNTDIITTSNGDVKMIQQFVLITEDGMKYTFGGSMDFIESNYVDIGLGEAKEIATSWYLAKIESPTTKAVVNYKYVRGKDNSTSNLGDLMYSQTIYNEVGQVSVVTGGELSTTCSNNVYISNPKRSFNFHHVIYLDEISYSDVTLKFHRSFTSALTFPVNDLKIWLNDGRAIPSFLDRIRTALNQTLPRPSDANLIKWMKLDSISILKSNVFEKGFNFLYNNGTNTTTQRLALTEIKEKGKNNQYQQPYAFAYYNLDLMPPFNSSKVDHWGYYNNIFADPFNVGSLAYANWRRPDPTYTTYGALSKITYPTKGTTEFLWESNDYGANVPIVRTQPLNMHAPKLVAGGPRIRKITATDPLTNKTLVKEYLYVKNYTPGANISTLPASGVLASQVQYTFDSFSGARAWGDFSFSFFFSTTNNQLPVYSYNSGNHVGYSEVVELTGNGYTTYKYSNYDNGYFDQAFEQTLLPNSRAYTSPYAAYSTREMTRGKLLEESSYKADGTPVKAILYQYADPQIGNSYFRFLDITLKVLCDGASVIIGTSYRKFNFRFLLASSTETQYDGVKRIEMQSIYSYNLFGQLKEVKKQNLSKGNSRIQRLKYVGDYQATETLCRQEWTNCRAGCNQPDRNERTACEEECRISFETCSAEFSNSVDLKPLEFMRINNIISTPIEVTNFVNYGSSNQVIESKLNKFAFNAVSNTVNIYQVYNLEVDANAAYSFSESMANLDNYQLSMDPFYRLSTELVKYDDFGNLVEATDQLGITYVQLWGYDARFPILQITNSTYTSVVSALGTNLALLASTAISAVDIRGLAQTLRSALPNAQVKANVFQPMNGLIETVDENGSLAKFEYDNFGRLLHVIDKDGAIVKRVSYSYKKN